MTVPSPRRPVPPAYDVSVVVAVHDVARELPAFLASLDAQCGIDPARVEVVAVDDGSTDDSLALLRAWQEHSPVAVTVLTKPHGGRSSARGYGLEYATGDWVTFPEPCDVLPPDLLARVLAFVGEHPGAELVGCGYGTFDDTTGRAAATTPPAGRAAAGDRLVDLLRTPWDVPTAPDAAFFRRARVEALGLRFDGTLRPGSDDADFCARYLLGAPAPVVGLLGSVRYLTRVRDGRRVADLAAAAARGPRRGPGLVDLLALGAARTGRAPEWVQTLVVDELTRIVGADGAPPRVPAVEGEDLVDLLREVRRHLDRHVVAGYRMRTLDDAWRQVLLDGLGDRSWRGDRVVVTGRDDEEGLVRVALRFTGTEPAVEYLVGGVPVAPVHTKVRTHGWLGRPLLAERIAWLPADGPLRVRVAGRFAEITTSWPGAVTTDADPRAVLAGRSGRTAAGAGAPDDAGRPRLRRLLDAVRQAVVARAARRHPAPWVLHVRGPVPDDGAVVRLFTHLREQRPDVDAWLAVEDDAEAFARLRAGRLGDTVVEVGSRGWRVLAVGAARLVSTAPDAAALLPQARFTWLRTPGTWGSAEPTDAGVHDLVVTSDALDHAALAGDGTPSVLTTKEVRLVAGLDPAGIVAALEDRRVVAGITLEPAVATVTPAPGGPVVLPAPVAAGTPGGQPAVPAGPTTPADGVTVPVARRPVVPSARPAGDGAVADLTPPRTRSAS